MSKSAKSVTVYGLLSTEDGIVRYIGQTVSRLETRRISHINNATRVGSHSYNLRSARWIRSVLSRGFDLIAFPLATDAVYNETEEQTIAWYRQQGFPLVNCTDGGKGALGYRWSPAQRAKASAQRRGRKLSPEWCANLSKSRKGKPKPAGFGNKISLAKKGVKGQPMSAEAKAKLSAFNKGKILSEDHRNKIRTAHLGRSKTDEHRKRLSDARKGKPFIMTPEQEAKRKAAAAVAASRRKEKRLALAAQEGGAK